MRLLSMVEGATVYMTPQRVAFAAGDERYTPTVGGTSHDSRERSGLISVQVCPPFIVFHRVFAAKSSVRGSVGKNNTGAVRSTRKCSPRGGMTSCACLVRRSNRVSLPP